MYHSHHLSSSLINAGQEYGLREQEQSMKDSTGPNYISADCRWLPAGKGIHFLSIFEEHRSGATLVPGHRRSCVWRNITGESLGLPKVKIQSKVSAWDNVSEIGKTSKKGQMLCPCQDRNSSWTGSSKGFKLEDYRRHICASVAVEWHTPRPAESGLLPAQDFLQDSFVNGK